eukprot:Nk52_evm5s354 gene=Nk52_evmTU5s354
MVPVTKPATSTTMSEEGIFKTPLFRRFATPLTPATDPRPESQTGGSPSTSPAKKKPRVTHTRVDKCDARILKDILISKGVCSEDDSEQKILEKVLQTFVEMNGVVCNEKTYGKEINENRIKLVKAIVDSFKLEREEYSNLNFHSINHNVLLTFHAYEENHYKEASVCARSLQHYIFEKSGYTVRIETSEERPKRCVMLEISFTSDNVPQEPRDNDAGDKATDDVGEKTDEA